MGSKRRNKKGQEQSKVDHDTKQESSSDSSAEAVTAAAPSHEAATAPSPEAAGANKSKQQSQKKTKAAVAAVACSGNNKNPPKSSFCNIQPPLSQGALDFLNDRGFHTMTPVQEATIPLLLQNKDVCVQAVTGSGKTLAFLLPCLERVRQRKLPSSTNPLSKHQIGVLILSPTRELAMQTWTVCSDLCKAMKMTPPLLLVGGGSSGSGSSGGNHRPVTEDLKTFSREANDVIIGTPGRMEDVLTRYKVIDVSELDVLILDEADVLLFGKTVMDPTIASILNRLPKMRRTGIFSATTTFTHNKSVKPLLQRAGMRNPVLVNVQVAAATAAAAQEAVAESKSQASGNKNASSSSDSSKSSASPVAASTSSGYTPTSLTNYYMVTKLEEKMSRFVAFLQSHRDQKMIVFFLTCACVDFYGNVLQKILSSEDEANNSHTKKTKKKKQEDWQHEDFKPVQIEILHGKLVQKRREKAMERFRGMTGGALFCTDVAARGLDVTDVDWVVQLDAPQDPSQFVHRVGRSARAGRKGSSLIFLTEKEEAYVDLLSNRKVPLLELPEAEKCHQEIRKVTDSKEDCDDISAQESAQKIQDVLPLIRSLVLKDRDILEKGTKAFTSYIRAYKEHVCAFIFRFASLDLGHLATSFCLLRLPKMPELRDCKGKLKNFTPAGPEVDIFAIPFTDKEREAARQKRLASELAAGGKNAKQIKASNLKAQQLQRQKERRQAAIDKGRNPEKKRGRHAQIVDEWEDLAKEERLYKKLRRGKITKEEFDRQMFGSSGSEMNEKSSSAQSDGGGDDDDSDDSESSE